MHWEKYFVHIIGSVDQYECIVGFWITPMSTVRPMNVFISSVEILTQDLVGPGILLMSLEHYWHHSNHQKIGNSCQEHRYEQSSQFRDRQIARSSICSPSSDSLSKPSSSSIVPLSDSSAISSSSSELLVSSICRHRIHIYAQEDACEQVFSLLPFSLQWRFNVAPPVTPCWAGILLWLASHCRGKSMNVGLHTLLGQLVKHWKRVRRCTMW